MYIWFLVMDDTYKTIDKASLETLFKEKGSKFYGYAFPVHNEGDVQTTLEQLRKKHSTARHFCYAWQLGVEHIRFRVNDDGEPSNSAGMPIYGQIQSFNVTNILIVSVRYFGGTKLGVGGLIQAYRTSAQLALEKSEIIEKTMNVCFQLKFEYPEMNTVMRFIKEHQLKIIEQLMDMTCILTFEVRKSDSQKIEDLLLGYHKITSKKLEV